MEKIVYQCGVRLARNYADLPFDVRRNEENALRCIQRVHGALGSDVLLLRLGEMDALNARALAESRRISPALLEKAATSAVFLQEDSSLSVMVGGWDHVQIRCVLPGCHLQEAAQSCFDADDRLSRQGSFAFDPELGYLTASPADAGTGMRATVMLHLPLLAKDESWKAAEDVAVREGLVLEASGHEDANDDSDLYALHNRGSLGRTEQETITAVLTAAREIVEMEQQLRRRWLESRRAALEDRIFRAWAVLNNARLLTAQEFSACWSGARLGAAMGLLPCTLTALDALPEQVCQAHLCLYAGERLENEDIDICRAERVRSMLATEGNE